MARWACAFICSDETSSRDFSLSRPQYAETHTLCSMEGSLGTQAPVMLRPMKTQESSELQSSLPNIMRPYGKTSTTYWGGGGGLGTPRCRSSHTAPWCGKSRWKVRVRGSATESCRLPRGLRLLSLILHAPYFNRISGRVCSKGHLPANPFAPTGCKAEFYATLPREFYGSHGNNARPTNRLETSQAMCPIWKIETR